MKKKYMILIIDDTPDIIDILGEILSDYEIRAANNGEKALEIAAGEQQPALILLDIMMPDMNGYEVCRRLKDNELTQSIPVIFVSGLREESEETKGLEYGAIDYITKPFKPNLIKQRVKNYLEMKLHQDKLENLIHTTTQEIVIRLIFVLEARDPSLISKIKKTYDYTILLAKKLGKSQTEAERIGLACTLHDVGKIGIPDNILLKPGKLNTQEWEIMKSHCEIGERSLRGGNSKLLEIGRIVALSHHENWDGSGYPEGLKEHEIPWEARITAIVDSFISMMSKRPYAHQLTLAQTIELMRPDRGIKFDSEILDVFLDSIPEFASIKRSQFDEDLNKLFASRISGLLT